MPAATTAASPKVEPFLRSIEDSKQCGHEWLSQDSVINAVNVLCANQNTAEVYIGFAGASGESTTQMGSARDPIMRGARLCKTCMTVLLP